MLLVLSNTIELFKLSRETQGLETELFVWLSVTTPPTRAIQSLVLQDETNTKSIKLSNN